MHEIKIVIDNGLFKAETAQGIQIQFTDNRQLSGYYDLNLLFNINETWQGDTNVRWYSSYTI